MLKNGFQVPKGSKLFKRIMIKLSGEALLGDKEFGIDSNFVDDIAHDISQISKNNIQICIVVGGGNIFRGVAGASQGIQRGTADSMGMLATVINAMAIQNSIEKNNIPSRVLSAVPMQTVCEPFIRRTAGLGKPPNNFRSKSTPS